MRTSLAWIKAQTTKRNPEFDQALLTEEFIQGAFEAWLLLHRPYIGNIGDSSIGLSWYTYLLSLVGLRGLYSRGTGRMGPQSQTWR